MSLSQIPTKDAEINRRIKTSKIYLKYIKFFLDFLTLGIGPIDCHAMSVRNYHSTLFISQKNSVLCKTDCLFFSVKSNVGRKYRFSTTSLIYK